MPGRIRIFKTFLGLCLVLATMTGCWSNRDIKDIRIAVAAGLDKSEDNKIELTIQLVKPSAIRGGQDGGAKQEKAFQTISEKGDTVFEAARNMLVTVDNKILLSHIQIIVIGEKLAREGVADVLDFFERDHESNQKSVIIIAKETAAKNILNAKSGLKEIPAMHLADIMENEEANGKIIKVMLTELIQESSPGKAPVAGAIEIIDKKETITIEDMRVEGAAVFKKDKLVGWMTPLETRGLLFTEDKVKSGIINISNPQDESKKIGIEILRSKGEKDVQLAEGKITCMVKIEEEGNVGEQHGTGDLTKQDMVKQMEEETEKAIMKEIRDVIQMVQNKYKCDVFGFGDEVYRKYPDYWEKVKDKWDEEFCQVAVEIKVESKIRRTGLTKKPVKPE